MKPRWMIERKYDNGQRELLLVIEVYAEGENKEVVKNENKQWTHKRSLSDSDFNWLVEQVERKQELEDTIYQDERQAVLEGMYERNRKLNIRVQELEDVALLNAKKVQSLTHQNDKNIKKNKRYREAIQKIKIRIKNLDERIERLSSEPQFYDRTKQIEGLCGVTLGLEEALEIIKEELEGVDND